MLRISVTVHAGARRRSVENVGETSFKVHTTTAPEKGKANEDVITLLAEHLGIRKSAISLERGTTSKKKVFVIDQA